MARKPLIGTVAENVLAHGTGALNIDGCRVGTNGGTAKGSKPQGNGKGIYGAGLHGACEITQLDAGRWPANLIHDGSEEVLVVFPRVKGATSRTDTVSAGMFHGGNAGTVYNDGANTSAARFFYCAKASKRDRDEGLEGFEAKKAFSGVHNNPSRMAQKNRVMDTDETEPRKNIHPTVKPTDLMRYLCRLITPPGGVVLDPFMGSGSTGKAAVLEGFQFIGIEREEQYVEIARARIEEAEETLRNEAPLFSGVLL